jgi:DNA-directed RNA polymerase subunit RPC12/RpoP
MALIFIIAIIVRARKVSQKCSKCGGVFELEAIEEPLGINITKKITFSMYTGPQKITEDLRCKNCGNIQKIKYWG